MRAQYLRSLLLLPAALRIAYAQGSNSSITACNNSPDLCDRAYNNITHLGAHDSPFLRDASTDYSISGNQYYNSTVQLSAGVRLLTAQVQTNSTSGELNVCHTSCDLLDAGKLSSWLSEVNTWMLANPSEVVTVLLVNGAGASASSLAAEYAAAGIDGMAYTPPVASATSNWPTLRSLINNGTRLLNFVADVEDNGAAPWLMNEFDFIFENSYENTSPADFSCAPDRPTSIANDIAGALSSGRLALINHFLYEQQAFNIQTPNDTYVNVTNSLNGGVGTLGSAATQCTNEYGHAPTFLLVDFFNVGPAIAAVDRLNNVTSPVGRATVSTAAASDSSSAAASVSLKYATLCLTVLASLVIFA